MIRRVLDETIGWYGTIAIVGAYALSSFNLLSNQTIANQVLNCTGALGIVYISLKKKAYQPGVLNIIWSVVALISIVRLLLRS